MSLQLMSLHFDARMSIWHSFFRHRLVVVQEREYQLMDIENPRDPTFARWMDCCAPYAPFTHHMRLPQSIHISNESRRETLTYYKQLHRNPLSEGIELPEYIGDQGRINPDLDTVAVSCYRKICYDWRDAVPIVEWLPESLTIPESLANLGCLVFKDGGDITSIRTLYLGNVTWVKRPRGKLWYNGIDWVEQKLGLVKWSQQRFEQDLADRLNEIHTPEEFETLWPFIFDALGISPEYERDCDAHGHILHPDEEDWAALEENGWLFSVKEYIRWMKQWKQCLVGRFHNLDHLVLIEPYKKSKSPGSGLSNFYFPDVLEFGEGENNCIRQLIKWFALEQEKNPKYKIPYISIVRRNSTDPRRYMFEPTKYGKWEASGNPNSESFSIIS
jgi:hypothetical protein